MKAGVGVWLCIMVVPFLIGMLVQFIVPLKFILTSHNKLDQAYQLGKSHLDQSTVRSVSFSNSRTLKNQLQLYTNLRSSLTRLFFFGLSYLTIESDQMQLNSAYELATADQQKLQGFNLNCSMWFARGVSSPSNFSEKQQRVVQQYKQVEPFIISYLSEGPRKPAGLLSLETYIKLEAGEMYFRFPSAVSSEFQQLDTPVLQQEYEATLLNYKSGYLETNFNHGHTLRICTPFLGKVVPIIGILCYQVSTSAFLQPILRSIEVAKLTLIRSEYFLLLPIYPSSDPVAPAIVANFTVQDLTNVSYSFQSQRLFPIQEGLNLSPSMFSGLQNYKMYIDHSSNTIYQENAAVTFYIVPVAIDFILGKQSISLYLIIINTEVEVNLSSEEFKDTTVALVVPAVLIICIAFSVTTLIMKKVLNKLDQDLILLDEYAMLILKGDLDLHIAGYEGAEDLTRLFEQFQTLNLLSKYSEPAYFQVPRPERIIRYLQCSELFEQLGYSRVTLFENIAECYFALNEKQKAIEYIALAVAEAEQTFFESGDDKDKLHEETKSLIQKKVLHSAQKRSKGDKAKEKRMRRMLLKEIEYLEQVIEPGRSSQSERLGSIIQKLKKLTYPRIFDKEYIICNIIEVRCGFQGRDWAGIQQKLQELGELVAGYANLHSEENEDSDILESQYRLLRGCWLSINRQPQEAFPELVRALQGRCFHPRVHRRALEELAKILQENSINPQCLDQLSFSEQYRPRGRRDYIFMIDTSNPKMGKDQIKSWKTRCRLMAESIFEGLMQCEDRLAIYPFCAELEVNLNLTKKQQQARIIRRELSRSFKCRAQLGCSQALTALRQAVYRVRNLTEEKIFIIFLKDGPPIDGQQITRIIAECQPNCKLIVVTDFPEQITEWGEQCYVVGIDSLQDIERLLGEKQYRSADTQFYIF